MKIAIINKHKEDTLGGSEIQCDIIARGLLHDGHTIHYLAMGGSGDYTSEYPVTAVEKNANSIFEAIKAINPDVIYWRYNKHYFFPAIRKIRALGIPLVFAVSHINDIKKWDAKSVSRDKPFHKRLMIKALRIVSNRSQYRGFRYVDGVIVNNDEFLNRLNVADQALIRSSVENVKHTFSWRRPFVIWVSSLKPSKRPEVCIEIAQFLQKKGVDLLMIGPIQKDSYNYFSDQNKLPDNLHYLGVKSLEEVNGAIHSSVCLIHTGEPEGFPNTFMQAWMQGKSIASFEYDPDGILKKEHIGFCADGKLKKFIHSLSSLIDEPEKREAMEKWAAHFAEKNFSPEHNVGLLGDFLEKVIRKKRGES